MTSQRLEGLYISNNGQTCFKSESNVKFEVEWVCMGMEGHLISNG